MLATVSLMDANARNGWSAEGLVPSFITGVRSEVLEDVSDIRSGGS